MRQTLDGLLEVVLCVADSMDPFEINIHVPPPLYIVTIPSLPGAVAGHTGASGAGGRAHGHSEHAPYSGATLRPKRRWVAYIKAVGP